MKKVLLIGSELGKGGAERSISLLSYYLEQHYDISLCILSGKEREKYYKTCKEVIFIDPPENKSAWGKIQAWRYRINKIRSIKKEKDIDVSISFLEGPDYANVLTRGKEKIVLSIRGSKMHDKVIAGVMGSVRKRVLIPFLYKKADQVICVTQALAGEMQEHFGIQENHLKTIYNFYETADLIQRSNEVLTEEEAKLFSKPVIITSGRLHVAKEQDKLIRILQKLKEKTAARLMILGDGELKVQLMQLTTTLGLTACDWETEQKYKEADVYFMGFQSNAFKYYKHSSLFALASSWEGFPNVLAEALICQIPVVSTDCYTGPREILDVPGLGKDQVTTAVRTPAGSLLPMLDVVTDHTITIWANEINHWLHSPAPSAADFTTLTDRFTLDAMIQQWKDVIEH